MKVALDAIAALEGIGTDLKKQVGKLMAAYKTFHASAQSVYQGMAKGANEALLTQQAMELGKQTPLIEKELGALTKQRIVLKHF